MEELKSELKRVVIDATNIDDVAPGDIDDDQPLFVEGLGLDSIDAMELAVALDTRYGVTISDSETARRAFASIGALADFVTANRTK